MSDKSSVADWPMAKRSVLVALSVWILCAIWIGTQMQVLPAGSGAGQLDFMARMALILLSLVLLSLFGWSVGRFTDASGGED